MKIKRIRAYQVDLPLHEGSYKWSGGKSVSNGWKNPYNADGRLKPAC
jgi:hypothetical protein